MSAAHSPKFADPLRRRLLFLVALWLLALAISALLSPHFWQPQTLCRCWVY